jgi:hypothetical protein
MIRRMNISPRGLFRGAILAVMALGLSACVTDDLGLDKLTESLSKIDLFGDDAKRTPMDIDELPAHVEVALAASVMRLRGQSAARVKKTLRVGGSEKVAPEANFNYSGFAVKDIELLELEVPEGRPLARKIGGFLHFADGYNRRAAVGFEIAYRLESGGSLVIDSAALAPAFPRGAKTVMYVVPAKALKAGLPKAKDYGDLYRLIRTSATPLRLPATTAPAPGAAERVIVVLFEDRLPNGDKVQVGISDVREGAASYTGATQYLVFKDGWVVAMIPGRFALGAQEAFWVKAVHTPAAGADGGAKPGLVGLFSTDPAAVPAS